MGHGRGSRDPHSGKGEDAVLRTSLATGLETVASVSWLDGGIPMASSPLQLRRRDYYHHCLLDWMFTSPHPNKFTCWNSAPQCGGVGRWGLWEVVRMRWGREGRVLTSRFSALLRVMREHAFSAMWVQNQKPTTWKRALPRTWLCWHLDLQLPASKTVRSKLLCL